MKKVKDVFYDLNDILVALIIVVLAAFVIVSNIDSILNYPTSIAEEIQTPEKDTPTHYADNPPIEQNQDEGTADDQTTSDAAVDQGSTNGQDTSTDNNQANDKPASYSVYINPGSTGQQIADILISVGLIKDRQEFYSAVTAAGADGKLKAGNFISPSDATPAEVVSIITN